MPNDKFQENDGLDPSIWRPIDSPAITVGGRIPPPPQSTSSPTLQTTLPPGVLLQPDLLKQQHKHGSVPTTRIWPQAPQGVAANNAATKSNTEPIYTQAQQAQASADSATSTANTANTNANAAVTGVATVNAKTAVGIVSGVLQQIPISSLGTSSATPNLDNLNNGTTFNRVLATALTSGAVDSTQPGVLAKGGCFPSSIVGTSSSLFTYTATASTHIIVISWSGFTIFFADGTTATVSSGTQSITGVTTGTFFYYPYLTAANVVTFVAGATGASGFTPNILYAPQSPQAAQAINLQSVTSLSASGGITVVMPSSGGGSGGGGGSQLCVRADQFVKEQARGVVRLNTCKPGEFLDSRHGYVEIKNLKFVPQSTFIRFTTGKDESLCVTPTHCLTVLRGGEDLSVEAARISLADVLYHVDGYATIKGIEIIEDSAAQKAVIHLEPFHEFWCGEKSPALNAHNQVPVS